jgi:hypothetical protein
MRGQVLRASSSTMPRTGRHLRGSELVLGISGRPMQQKKAPGRLNRRGRVVFRGTLGGSNDDHSEIIGEDSGGIEVVDAARMKQK